MEPTRATPAELAPLHDQLARMRAMLALYSRLFFVHMRTYTIVTLAILVASRLEPLGGSILIVAFLVPFVFLEASYLFWYTVFARRHAEWLERTIARRSAGPVPLAHRLEAAWFYPPEGRKVAAFSLARPTSHMSAMTVGYALGAGIVWVIGVVLSVEWVRGSVGEREGLLYVAAAVAWTVVIAGYLLWTWLRADDERRLVEALDATYPDGVRHAPDRAPEVDG